MREGKREVGVGRRGNGAEVSEIEASRMKRDVACVQRGVASGCAACVLLPRSHRCLKSGVGASPIGKGGLAPPESRLWVGVR